MVPGRPDGRRIRTERHGNGKRWLARYTDPEGRRHSRAFARQADAERFVAGMATDVARGEYLDPAGGRTRFGDYARAWLAAQTFGASTRQQVELRLRLHIYPTWDQVGLGAIKPSAVQKWLAGLSASMAPTTVRQIFIHFSAILRAAVEDELIGKNPCRSPAVSTPTLPRRRVVPWQRSAVRAVIDAHPDRYRALPALAAGAGLRQGEIFGLAVEDIDFLRRTIRVLRQVKYVGNRLIFAPPKYAATRGVPLSEGLAVVLAEQICQFPPVEASLPWKEPDAEKPKLVSVNLVFTSREHKPLNKNYINAFVWKEALRAAGVPTTRENGMHALRHFCASNWLEQGVSIRAVAEYLGHSDESFTLRTYTHLMPSAEDKTRLATDAWFSPSAEAATV